MPPITKLPIRSTGVICANWQRLVVRSTQRKPISPTASLIAMFPYERSEAIMALSIELSRNVLSQAL